MINTYDLVVGDQTYHMTMNLNVMCHIEDLLGRNMVAGDIGLNISFTDLLKIVWASILPKHPDITMEDLGQEFTIGDSQELLAALPVLMNQASDDPKALAPYVLTPNLVIEEALDMADLKEGEVFMDLGCAEGNTLRAALLRGAKLAIGIEMDKGRVQMAKELLSTVHAKGKYEVLPQYIQEACISQADVIFMYLMPASNAAIRSKLLAECKPGCRIISHDFSMPNWSRTGEVKEIVVPDDRKHWLYLYVQGDA